MESLIEELIVEKAESFIGKKEKPGNMGFKDSVFDKLMRSIGFKDTHAWCAYFCELVWTEFYSENDDRKLEDLKRLFSGGAVRTFRRFKEDPNWETGTTPRRGSIAIWQSYRNGKKHWSGHAAICTSSGIDGYINSIDGNTNSNGSREGVEVASRTRVNNLGEKKGLVLIGFIHPRIIKEG